MKGGLKKWLTPLST